ncbi:porin [Hydrogenophaga palleronii]|uniref:porin n=1 Tax=Hydrogenophaga palleronii TaxID=65655 RepID=UPI00082644A5|nr:porin [Hydrogenophaga palleronii]
MKKTLIALAAVAAASASFAQSSVTLSGTVDVGLEDRGGANSPLRMESSRLGTSNWTISGAEDLGGGLKAIFKVSTSFNADEGTTNGNVLGNNDMFVGLQGGFGSIKLGRSFNPTFFYALTANSTKGVTGYQTRANTVETDGVYVSNQVLYTTPNFGGFSGQISYAPSEVAGASAHRGVGLSYAAGPLVVNFAHSKLAAGVPGATVNSLNLIAASYDFNVAKLLFTYTDRSNVASDADNTWGLGVTVPLGAGQLWASYDRSEVGAGTTRVIHGGYKYFLSKRTTAYVNVGNKKNALVGFNGSPADKAITGWGVGLAHNF